MSSHRALDAETRARIGIGDGLVRLSIGIEDPRDIVEDLEQALRRGMVHLHRAMAWRACEKTVNVGTGYPSSSFHAAPVGDAEAQKGTTTGTMAETIFARHGESRKAFVVPAHFML